jgi:hypothetical protein
VQLAESIIGIRHMKAGKPKSGYWATPAPGTKAEFELDSVQEGCMSFSLTLIPAVVIPASCRLPLDAKK